MASKQAGRQVARSPGRSASPGKAGQEPPSEKEQALLKEVAELKKYKEQELKEKKKDEAQKKKEMTAAKKRITKEVQNAMKAVKKHDQEVMKLTATIKKLQIQETDVKKKTVETETKFKEKLNVTEVKHQDMETKLAQKYADAAQERIKLQQLQLQLDTLANNNIDLSKPGALPSGMAGALSDSGRRLPALNDSAVETTDAEGEERYAMAESEVARLAQQLDDMRAQWEEAEDQKKALSERLAQMIVQQPEAAEALGGEDIHKDCREAIDSLRRELDRLREENEGLHAKLHSANKALELQEECIEELAGRASGVGEGLMSMASQELARCSILQSESRFASNACSRRDSADISAETSAIAEEGGGWRRMAEDEPVIVGELVRLNVDSKSVREAFRSVGFAWEELIDGMLGKSFQIVEVPKQGIVGLPSPDGSQGVLYFPIAALQKATSQPPTPQSASATASTAATYQRASYASKGARIPPPGRQSGFQGGGSGRPGIALSAGSSGSAQAAAYPTHSQSPVSPPSFAGCAGGAPECTPQPASPAALATALGASTAACTQVFVGSVPSDLPDDRLMAEFAKYGVVVDMQVQRDDSGPQKSYAFLTYQTPEEASRAVEAASVGRLVLPGATMPSEVGFARGAQVAGTGLQPGAAQPVLSGTQAQVIVRCIPIDVREDALMAEFGKYGAVVNVQVQRDPAGPEKTCAVVTYHSRDDAVRAAEAAGSGRIVLPGATAPCEVSFLRSGPPAATLRQQPAGQQVIVYSVPMDTSDDLLLAEFAKFGTVVDFKLQRDASGLHKSYAIVTYNSTQEAARAVEVTNGRLMMPGAAGPAQVGFIPVSQPVTGQLLTARQKPGLAGQVLVCSVPVETSEEVLKAEFAKYGIVTEMQMQTQRDASGQQKSHAFVTYHNREEAARAVEALSGGLLLPGASSPCEVGFAARTTQAATGQLLTPGQLLSLRQGPQARPQSAPRLRSGPTLVSAGAPTVNIVAANGDVRRQVSGVPPGSEVTDTEGTCAWASPDPRRFVVQGQNRLDLSIATAHELDVTRGRQVPHHDLSASVGALHSARRMVQRPWQPGMASEPIAMAPVGAELRQLSPSCHRVPAGAEMRQLSPSGQRSLAGTLSSSPTLAPGSAVAPAGPYAEHQQLLQVPGQAGRVVAYRSSPGTALRPGVMTPAGVPVSGTASPGVYMVPAPGAAWRGGPMPSPWANAPRQQVPMPINSGPPSAKGSYIPPVPGMQGGQVLPPAAGGVNPADTPELSASAGRVGFKEAVSKVTAKALREFRQNHRASLAMD